MLESDEATMKAVRLHQYGNPDVLVYEDAPRPHAHAGQVLVRIHAAGVGVWDPDIRRGAWREMVDYPLPLILGTDVAGEVAELGEGVTDLEVGEAVYGVVDMTLSGSNAEYGLASAEALAPKPSSLSFEEAAAAPIVAATAWQMLFDLAKLEKGQTVLVHGAAGSVGSFAVQFAKRAGARVIGTASERDVEAVRALGADQALDYRAAPFDKINPDVDVVIDLIGGDTRKHSWDVLKRGGTLVAASESFSDEDQRIAKDKSARTAFVEADPTTKLLANLTEFLDTHQIITTQVGAVLPLSEARRAHEMIESHQHPRGKIVLRVP